MKQRHNEMITKINLILRLELARNSKLTARQFAHIINAL